MITSRVFVLLALLGPGPALAQDMAAHAHGAHLGASVMAFDLDRSTHIFTPTPDGGTQSVVSKDNDAVQIALIRSHLQKEAEAFARGNYADPLSIHGHQMPGVAELQAGSARVRVGFAPLPDGARLRFTTTDRALVGALHRWFDAQVGDHGADAVMKP